MCKINEIVYVNLGASEVPVGTVKDYITLTESETTKLLYLRLNRNRTSTNRLDIKTCTEHARILQESIQKYFKESPNFPGNLTGLNVKIWLDERGADRDVPHNKKNVQNIYIVGYRTVIEKTTNQETQEEITMVVRGNPRIKIYNKNFSSVSALIQKDGTVVIPKLQATQISSDVINSVGKFVKLNLEIILKLWNGDIDKNEFESRIRKV